MAKLFVPLIKGPCFSKVRKFNFPKIASNCGETLPLMSGTNNFNFWKIEFLKEYRQAKMVKIYTILNCVKKIFLSKLFVPLIKGSVSPQFMQNCGETLFWKIEFLTEYRQTLQKW